MFRSLSPGAIGASVENLADGIIEQLDRRLNTIERAIGELRQEMAAINRRLDVQFRWLIGIQFGVVGLLISILLKG